MLTEPQHTPFDWTFRLFGVHCRVLPWFWLISALLGYDLAKNPPAGLNPLAALAIWILVCFVSILLHEFGHVWMGQVFGTRGHILLQGMGGLAIGASDLTRRWQRVLVIAAGPGIQLVLYFALLTAMLVGVIPTPSRAAAPVAWMIEYAMLRLGFNPSFTEMHPALAAFLSMMLTVNLLWPIINLLPVLPLDGGQITREACTFVSPGDGTLWAWYISLGTSIVLAVNSLLGMNGRAFLPYLPADLWMAVMFGMLALLSWQGMQAEQYRRNTAMAPEDDLLPWER